LQGYYRQKYIFKKIKKYIKKWSNVLEIWFWDWFLLNKLSNAWYNAFWQDISKSNIEITRKQWDNEKINFIHSMWNWKIEGNNDYFDCFVASEVLEHMNDNDLLTCINEIYRILKKWWMMFITFPAEENLKSNECICPNCEKVFHKWWHKQCWDLNKIKTIFLKFKIILIEERSFKANNLNFLGIIEYYIKNLFNFFWRHINWNTYFIILRK
jgi:hypothetical protein